MSRLVNLGPGDVTDRLTVLALKIFYGGQAGRDTKHWADERNALLVQLKSRTLNGVWFEQVLELGAVNAALWHATDQLREYGHGKCTDPEIRVAGELGLQILAWNDRRAELVDQINKAAGESRGQEKL